MSSLLRLEADVYPHRGMFLHFLASLNAKSGILSFLLLLNESIYLASMTITVE